jgi:hypothetical protein
MTVEELIKHLKTSDKNRNVLIYISGNWDEGREITTIAEVFNGECSIVIEKE